MILSLPIDLQGFSAAQHRDPIRKKRRCDLLDLASPTELRSNSWPDLRQIASRGIRSLVPLRRHFRRASPPSRVRRLDFRHPGANQAARSVLVVSHHLDGLLRSTDSGVLQPVPARVRRVWPLSPPAPASWFEAR